MKLEHVAINVKEPLKMAEWYEKHLGLVPVKKMAEPPFMVFLADDSGAVMLEIYANPKGETLAFRELHPLTVHLAFVSENPGEDKRRIVQAGAEVVSDDVLEDGSRVVMLRDPWGVAIQLCKRTHPMLRSLP